MCYSIFIIYITVVLYEEPIEQSCLLSTTSHGRKSSLFGWNLADANKGEEPRLPARID